MEGINQLFEGVVERDAAVSKAIFFLFAIVLSAPRVPRHLAAGRRASHKYASLKPTQPSSA